MRSHSRFSLVALALFVLAPAVTLALRGAKFSLPKLRKQPLPKDDIAKALRALDMMGWNELVPTTAETPRDSNSARTNVFNAKDPLRTMHTLITNPGQIIDLPMQQVHKVRANIESTSQRVQTKLFLDRIGPTWSSLFPGKRKPSVEELTQELGIETLELAIEPAQVGRKLPFTSKRLNPRLSRLLSAEVAYRLVQLGLWGLPDVTNYTALILGLIANEAKESEKLPPHLRKTAALTAEFVKYYQYYTNLVTLVGTSRDAIDLVKNATERMRGR